MKLTTDLKPWFPFAVKTVQRDSLCDNVSHNIVGRDEMGIMRALNHGNMVYLHEVMTCAKMVYLVIACLV